VVVLQLEGVQAGGQRPVSGPGRVVPSPCRRSANLVPLGDMTMSLCLLDPHSQYVAEQALENLMGLADAAVSSEHQSG